MSQNSTGEEPADGHRGTSPHRTPARLAGVTIAEHGYLLGPIAAPAEIRDVGRLSFQIFDVNGEVVTRFVATHEKTLHLIIVRTDGTQFRHVHPSMDTDGTWSLPWDWAQAGTYRVYADFVPDTDSGSRAITLTRTIHVAGNFLPAPGTPSRTAKVDGFTVELTGDLFAGSPSQLILRVTKGGQPVTTLQPYLGAFGHLVALRDGDLAYLHVHPHGDEPAADDLAGPTIEFAAEPPTPGRYLLYLDFQVDQQVHTAPFIADAASGPDRHGAHAASHAPQVQTHAQPGTGTSAGALGRGYSH